MDCSTVILGVLGLFCHFYDIFLWKILLANNIDPDQMPYYLAFDLSLHCFPMTLLWVPGKIGLISLLTQRCVQATGEWYKTLFCEMAVSLCLVSKTFTDSEIIGLILSQFENRVPLNPVLGSMGSGAPLHYCTQSAIFISLMCSLLPESLHSEFIPFMYFGMVTLANIQSNLNYLLADHHPNWSGKEK